MDDGVRSALAASSLAGLSSPATLRLLTGARLVRIPAGAVTHREGETAEHLELVVDGLVRAFVTAPGGRTMTAELVGRPVVAVVACYAGDVDDGERVLRPMRGFGSPVLDVFASKPFLAHQQMFDPSFRHGCWYYVRSCDVADLSDDVIDIVVEHGRRISSPLSSIALWQMGGAVARVGEDETAFNGRGPASRSTATRRPLTGSTSSGSGRVTTGPRSRRSTRVSTSTSSWRRGRPAFAWHTAKRSTNASAR